MPRTCLWHPIWCMIIPNALPYSKWLNGRFKIKVKIWRNMNKL
ncbi:hypothetical protein F383_17910 [Gossypium arboreum]|uniref:Uncharacterized protein n=1 Tax=Gossypium arboreum TaxID=29729 RepID=A0A0B0NTN2_GOSAR|nr:hypothetical protein F383_17910 [Gossypium arboreum]